MKPVVAVDPGTNKCGLAVLSGSGEVLDRQVLGPESVPDAIREAVETHGADTVVLGDRTAARAVWDRLRRSGLQLQTVLVDEHRSSEQARERYFKENPPRGWRKLIPRGLLLPPCPVDDYVAVILAERYLGRVKDGG